MVSRIYMYLLAIGALLVSMTGAYFSVTGLAALFAGKSTAVIVMAGSLEFSKLVVVGFLYRYWGHIHRPLKAYLIFSVVVLMGITSLGIYGYLSNAYQIAALDVHMRRMHIEAMEKENQRLQEQIHDFQGFIDKIPNSRISRKFEFQKVYEPKVLELRAQAEQVIQRIDRENQDALALQTKTGPVYYLATAFGMDADDVVKYLILVFVSVFDPLAVSLVFGLNLVVRLREKYRGDELKIGARAITSPVDHRFKKSA